MEFGRFILRKIFKFVATRCKILRLKWSKFSFVWGSVPGPTGGTYSTPQTFHLDLRDLLQRKGRGMSGNGMVGEGGETGEKDGRWGAYSSCPRRNPEKYPDCRTDLIGGGGNTDVCPGRQTPSCRHWVYCLIAIIPAGFFYRPVCGVTWMSLLCCWWRSISVDIMIRHV